MALVDAAERLAGRYPGFLGVRTFIDSLADQQIPAEAVADRGTRADAVRILTAHRAKGLEWDEVWIVGAEEGVWPDLRARGSTLRAEELTSDRRRRRSSARRSARGGAAAVLRGLHARPAPAARHGDRREGRGR